VHIKQIKLLNNSLIDVAIDSHFLYRIAIWLNYSLHTMLLKKKIIAILLRRALSSTKINHYEILGKWDYNGQKTPLAFIVSLFK
jgi:hypothetical protein